MFSTAKSSQYGPTIPMLQRDLENMTAAYKEEVEKRLLAEQKIKQLGYREQTRSQQQQKGGGDGSSTPVKGIQQLRNLGKLAMSDEGHANEPNSIEVGFDENLMGKPLFQFVVPNNTVAPNSPAASSPTFAIDMGSVLPPLLDKIIPNGKPVRTKLKVRMDKTDPSCTGEKQIFPACIEQNGVDGGNKGKEKEKEKAPELNLTRSNSNSDVEPNQAKIDVLLPLTVEVALQDLAPLPNKPAKTAFPPSLTFIPPYGLCEVSVRVVMVNEKRREELRAKMEEEERVKLEAERKRKEEEERMNRELEMMRAEDEASAFAYLDPVVIDVYPALHSITDEVDVSRAYDKEPALNSGGRDSLAGFLGTTGRKGSLPELFVDTRKGGKRDKKEERERSNTMIAPPPEVVLVPEAGGWHQVSQEEKLKKLLQLNEGMALTLEDMPNYFGIVEKGAKQEKMIIAIKKEEAIYQSRGKIEIPRAKTARTQRESKSGSMIDPGQLARLKSEDLTSSSERRRRGSTDPKPKPSPRKKKTSTEDDLSRLDKSDTELEVSRSQTRRQNSQRSLAKHQAKVARKAKKKRARKASNELIEEAERNAMKRMSEVKAAIASEEKNTESGRRKTRTGDHSKGKNETGLTKGKSADDVNAKIVDKEVKEDGASSENDAVGKKEAGHKREKKTGSLSKGSKKSGLNGSDGKGKSRKEDNTEEGEEEGSKKEKKEKKEKRKSAEGDKGENGEEAGEHKERKREKTKAKEEADDEGEGSDEDKEEKKTKRKKHRSEEGKHETSLAANANGSEEGSPTKKKSTKKDRDNEAVRKKSASTGSMETRKRITHERKTQKEEEGKTEEEEKKEEEEEEEESDSKDKEVEEEEEQDEEAEESKETPSRIKKKKHRKDVSRIKRKAEEDKRRVEDEKRRVLMGKAGTSIGGFPVSSVPGSLGHRSPSAREKKVNPDKGT